MVWGSIAGAVAGSLVSKALGGGSTQPSTSTRQETVPGSEFQPYTYTTGLGTITGTPEGDYGYSQTAQLSPELAQLQQLGLGQAPGFYQQYAQQLGATPEYTFNQQYAPQAVGFDYTTAPTMFGGQYDAPTLTAQYDPSAEVANIFAQESALLEPKFAQQATNLQERLFGTGRLGLQLASQEAGGQINPEAYGLQRAQQQTMAELAASATQRGQQAAQQRFTAQQAMDAASRQRALDIFGGQKDVYALDQAARESARQADISRFSQQLAGMQEGRAGEIARLGAESDITTMQQQLRSDYLNRLLSGGTGMFGLASSVYDVENAMRKAALEQEVARSAAMKPNVTTTLTSPVETNRSILAGQLAPAVSQGVQSLFNNSTSSYPVSNMGFGPASGQSWGSYANNLTSSGNAGLWSGGSSYQNADGSAYYDAMNDFWA